ncbi:TetR/AcrR family transcriptional regulator [Taklimakanibacter lacteus]|uniref:TetR/AcrR family transcriptional regulator n=1 Tax=Taklimakanibacter lacteus TaxID=2268456 RepID=UPI000E6669FB
MDDQALLATVAGSTSASLTRADWLAAAIRLFIDEGVGSVRITRLADELEVTRGSFYWHFTGRDDLLAAIVEFWGRKNTRAVVSAFDGLDDLTQGVLALFDAWIDPELFDPRLDLAIREWARRDKAIHRAVAKADAKRIQAICDFYCRSGFARKEAFIRARVIYFTQIGYYALEVKETLAERLDYLESYYLSFTGRTIDPAAAEAYRRRHPGA